MEGGTAEGKKILGSFKLLFLFDDGSDPIEYFCPCRSSKTARGPNKLGTGFLVIRPPKQNKFPHCTVPQGPDAFGVLTVSGFLALPDIIFFCKSPSPSSLDDLGFSPEWTPGPTFGS